MKASVALLGLVAVAKALPASLEQENSSKVAVRTPQMRGGGPPSWGSGRDHGDKDKGKGGPPSKGSPPPSMGGGCGSCGKPDVPYTPDKPSHPDMPSSPQPPSHDDNNSGDHGDDGYDNGDDWDGGMDIPDVTIEDIIEAEQKLVIIQNLLDTIDDPAQRKALEMGLEQLKAFLKEHAGITDISAPPGVGTIMRPGLFKREESGREDRKPERDHHHDVDREDIFAILDEYNSITHRYSRHNPPPFPIFMIACQLAALLEEEGVHVDTEILDVWSHLTISDKKVKRQDGIFTLPGSCRVDDIIGLQTILATIELIYGSNPPSHIASLRNAVLAALVFCGVSDAETGGMIPDNPSTGGGIIPDKPSEGGGIVPDKPSDGGALVPDKPSDGGALTPDKPSSGGAIVPDKPSDGGDLVPEDPVEGGQIKPSD